MRRLKCLGMGMAIAMTMAGQGPGQREIVVNTEEDPSEVTTIADIIALEESDDSPRAFTVSNNTPGECNSFLNVGFNLAKLTPKHEIPVGYDYNRDLVPPFKSDWGVSLQVGHTYRLHKKPIGGMLYFNIDAVFADLNLNHYSTEPGTDKLYNSGQTWGDTGADGECATYHFMPWCLEKYEANLGITAGPSVTLQPFDGYSRAHDLKFNVFYHVGYHASLLWIQNDLGRDANPTPRGDGFNPVNDDIKLSYGLGFVNGFGLNIDWKNFGVGVEQRYGYLDYHALQKRIYGGMKYRYIDEMTRVYLRVRF